MQQDSMGSYLRARREERGLTQADVARALGATQPIVSRWERDKSVPAGDNLKMLISLLEIPLAQLAVRQMGLCTEVEYAIVDDKLLPRRDQDALLAAYGVLTDRDSLNKAALLRMPFSPGSENATSED